jgi:hypothetical protein
MGKQDYDGYADTNAVKMYTLIQAGKRYPGFIEKIKKDFRVFMLLRILKDYLRSTRMFS